MWLRPVRGTNGQRRFIMTRAGFVGSQPPTHAVIREYEKELKCCPE